MKKMLKILSIIILSILVLLITAVVVVSLVIDPNDYKPQIVNAVKDNTGRDIIFGGDIKLTFFPQFGVAMNDVSLSNAQQFTPDSMLSFKQLAVGIKVLPLLQKKVEIEKINVDSLSIYYAVNKDNVTNIDDILQVLASKKASPINKTENTKNTDKSADAPKSLPISINDISISEIAVTNIVVGYSDGRSGKAYTLGPLNIKTGIVRLGKPVDIAISGSVEGKSPDFKTDFNIDSTVSLALADNLSFTSATIASKLKINFALIQQGIDTQIQGHFNGMFDNNAKVAKLDGFSATVKASGKPIPNERQTINTDISSLIFDITKQTLDLSNMNISMADVALSVNVKGEKMMSNPSVVANINIKEFSPKQLSSNMGLPPIDTTDPKALTKAMLELNVTYFDKVAKVPNMVIKVDDTTAKIAIVADIRGKKPTISVNANIDTIDVDRYMPKAGSATTPATADSKQSAPEKKVAEIKIPEIDIDLTPLPDININAVVGKIKVKNILIDSVTVPVTLKNGVLTVSKASIKMYNASMDTTVKVVGLPKKFSADVSSTLTPLNIQPIITAATGNKELDNLPKKVSYSIAASFSSNILNVSKIDLRADDIIVAGKLGANLQKKPAITFDFDINDVNLNKYLPPKKDQPTTTTTPGTVATTQPVKGEEPLEIDLKDIPVNVDGKVKVKSVVYDKYTIKNILAAVYIKDGLVKIDPASLDIFGGSIKSTAVLSGNSKALLSAITTEMKNLRTEELLATFAESKKPFLNAGLSANLKLNTKGLDKDSILSNLNGGGSYVLSNGVMKGFGYNPKQPLKSMMGDDQVTTLSDVKGNVTVKNGQVTTEKVTITAQNFKMDLEGGFNLKDLSLDYTANSLVEKYTVPLKITGSFKKPQFSIDEKALMNSVLDQEKKKLEDKAKKELEKESKKLEDKLKKETGNVLKNIFK